ncbi:MAG: hypothetical protein KH230_17060 [Enterocloster asparagiformis]|nr:hypothetical protein [Enterocloster asparagiformis]
MGNKRRKQAISLILCGALVFGQPGAAVYAEVGAGYRDGLCEHHPEHDGTCGYVEGHACEHEHTDECYNLVKDCIFDEEASPSEAVKKDHICTEESGCITEVLDCRHVHTENGSGEDSLGGDDDCGYVKAKPCRYDCEICNPKGGDETDNGSGTGDNHETDNRAEDWAEDIWMEEAWTETVITGWEWIDPDEMLTDGGLALPGVNPENQADFDTVVSMLPEKIEASMIETATGSNARQQSEITLSGWKCSTYKQDNTGAWPVTGEYIFTNTLPEGYALSDEAAPLEIKVTLGGANMLAQEEVKYLTCDEDGKNWENGTKGSGEYTKVASSDTAWGQNDGAQHWYVAEGEVDISSRITVTGDVHLILKDSAKLNATEGITVAGDNNSLTIYAQSTGDDVGKLTATATYMAAGIGGGSGESGGIITINGGTIKAQGGENGAGIGGGYEGSGGTITINGGTITATGSIGAGIGGGFNRTGGTGGTITINGGMITAEGTRSGAGIGGGAVSRTDSGSVESGGNITITGDM